MSLIKCPECGKVFSDRAAHCPQCGLPTEDALKVIVNEQGAHTVAPQTVQPAPQPVVDNNSTPQKNPNNSMLYILIGVVIVLAIACIALLVSNKFGSASQSGDDADTTASIPELPADTNDIIEDTKVVQPQAEPEAPTEAEPEEMPEPSQTEEIQSTPTPAPAQSTPTNTPAEPAHPTQPAQ